MKIITIEVSDNMYENLTRGAYDANARLEEFIANILDRYMLDKHIMETKEVADAYQECGEVNLEIANL